MPSLLLITPENNEIKRFRACQYNNFIQLTMPYLAGFAPEEYKMKLVDEHIQAVMFDAFDVVAITVNTPNAPHVYQMAGKFRQLGAWVVLGGPHVTLLPEEASLYADTIFIGEAEETWPVFLMDFLKGHQKSVYKSAYPPSLEGLPIPRRDLVAGNRLTKGSVFATRGCPHNCSFCCLKKIYHQEFRARPLDEVVEDIKSIPNRHFVFWDDNFFADPLYTKNLLKELIPLKKKWAAQVTAYSCLDEQLLALAKKAGCVYLFLGLESFSNQSLRDARKEFNVVDQYKLIINKIHGNGICVQAGVVFGFDADNLQTFDLTLDLCESLGVDGATVSILTPYPGSSLYSELKDEGRILPVDWSYYNGKTKVSFKPKQMTPEELLAGYNSFRRQFYSYRSIMKRLAVSRVNIVYNLSMNLGYKRAYQHYCRHHSPQLSGDDSI